MGTRYCQLCEPYPELIDDDSIAAIGYMKRGKRKIHLCGLCIDGQKRYHDILYYDESMNTEKVSTCNHGISSFKKKNLVTMSDESGAGYDILKCEVCGYERKRYWLGN